ncbi:MAG: histidinol-phosphate transaminase [Spirulina sp. SIO3F2]|nr:histidinol-phosphate transaminase [Spirulina sp. SIO3F2]
MLDFIREDLKQFQAYTPHPGGAVTVPLDILDTNENPYDLPSDLKAKLAGHYEHAIATNRYPDGAQLELKSAIASYVNRSANLPQAPITPAQISVGNGSDELIRSVLIATCLGNQGAIFTAPPTFSMYRILAETLGIPVVQGRRSTADFALDLEDARSQVQAPVRVVFVVHPNSPTANPLTANELDWLRRLPKNILVVIDEAYFEFSQTSVVAELSEHPNWVILRTFSKAFRLAALRVGYAIAHPDVIQILEKVRLPYNLPAFSQAAARLALDHHEELLTVIPQLLQARDQLHADLAKIDALQVWPSAANFIYARLNNGDDKRLGDLTQELKAQGTLIRHTGGGWRITVGTSAENQRTLSRMHGVLA